MSQPNTQHWHLFIDDHLLARTTGFDRVVHHPRAIGVVISADQPWETAGVAPMHVSRDDDGRFTAYYSSMWWDIDSAGKLPGNHKHDRAHHIFMRIGYATSDDGIHWHKPTLGLVDAPAGTDWQKHWPYPTPQDWSKANNLGVPFVIVSELGRNGNVSDPAKRFALRIAPDQSGEAAGVGSNWRYMPRGYFAAELPDFLHDPAWREKLVDSGGDFNPRRNQIHFWDEIHQEWVAMDQGVVPHWLPSREIARFGSKDLVNWRSHAAVYPDALDPHSLQQYDEPMGLVPFYADGNLLGLLSWFHSDRTDPDGGPVLEPTSEHPYHWPYCRKGTNEMRITTSRDGGFTWDRTSSRQAWIAHGSEEESYDRLVITPQPPLRVGNEDWFFIGVVDGDHLITRNSVKQSPYAYDRVAKHQIALYIQKHNRYVSLTARNYSEVLITNPVEVKEDTLYLNVDASRGQLRAAIATAEPVMTFDGKTPSTAPHLLPQHLLPGFTFETCEVVRANSIEHEVRFTSGGNLASLRGQSVSLLFEMVNADLYGFRI
jgi:hypothetical protein